MLHTNSGAVERMLNKPVFDGHIELGKKYILIDDVITSGSTLNELKNFIESKGGKVVDVMSLAAGVDKNTGHYSGDISLKPETKNALEKVFDINELNKTLYENGIAENYKGLSQSQAKTILSLKNVDRLRAKIDERRLRTSLEGNTAETGNMVSGRETSRREQKIISTQQYQKAIANLKKLPDKLQSNPLDFYSSHLKDLLTIGTYYFERGVRSLTGLSCFQYCQRNF